MKEEREYRANIKKTYEKILKAFESVDPDVAEVEEGLGTLTILTKKGKIILSTQPSVRQLWLAVATIGVAKHFHWDDEQKVWRDDKDQQVQLFGYLEQVLKESSGLELLFK